MRLLYVIPYFAPAWAYGGPPRVALDFASQMVGRGHSVRVITTDAHDADTRLPAGPARIDGIDVVRVRNLSNSAAWRYKVFLPVGFRRALRSVPWRPDVVHLYDFRAVPNALAVDFARRERVPWVLSAFGELPRASGVKRFLKVLYDWRWGYRTIRDAAALLSQTPDESAWYRRFGGRTEQVVDLPLPVDLSQIPASGPRNAYRHRIGLSSDHLVVLFLGRIHAYKGIGLLIQAFAAIQSRHPHAQLVVAGRDDGYLAEARALANQIAPGRVVFPGPVYEADRFAAYRDADVFAITPSHAEQTSLAALEACACGVPVVTTHQAPIPGLDEANAGITTEYSLPEVAAALDRALGLPAAERRAMGDRAERLVQDRYSLGVVADQLEQVYRSAAGAHGRS